MATPVLSRNPNFSNRPEYANFGGVNRVSEPITVENTLQKTAFSFAVLLAAAALGWFATPALGPAVMVIGVLGGLVFGLINSFKREPSPVLILLYAGFEGLALGGISNFFERAYPGAVFQAVLGTLVVTGLTLALFTFAGIRASAKATKVFLIAMVGYLVFSLINGILVWTGANDDPYGLRGSVHIFGIPLGIVLGLFAVVLAAYSLVTDFTFIEQAVKYGWTASFGIMVTIVWLYLEILRMIGLARR
jgi:uncharacterized YccA/Bax inhibitor family protein